MGYIINVGLASTTTGVITDDDAIAAVRAAGFGITFAGFAQSDTERTLIATVSAPAGLRGTAIYHSFSAIAEALHQDCIAVFSPSHNIGSLIGPRAEAWGAFDPARFLTPWSLECTI